MSALPGADVGGRDEQVAGQRRTRMSGPGSRYSVTAVAERKHVHAGELGDKLADRRAHVHERIGACDISASSTSPGSAQVTVARLHPKCARRERRPSTFPIAFAGSVSGKTTPPRQQHAARTGGVRRRDSSAGR